MKLNPNVCLADVRVAMQHLEMAVTETDNVDIKKELVYNIHALGLLKKRIDDALVVDEITPVTTETLDD